MTVSAVDRRSSDSPATDESQAPYEAPRITPQGNIRDLVAGMGAVSIDHNGKVSKH